MPSPSALPSYAFREELPNLIEMGLKGISDVAAMIPREILTARCVQLPSPPIGPKAPLVIADPELAREVLLDRDGKFGRDILMKRLMRRSWGRGLAAAEGDDWRRQRKAAAPMFRSGEVSKYAPSFARAANDVVSEWDDGEVVDLSEIAGRIVARVVFGVLVSSGHDVDQDAVAAEMPHYVDRIAGFDLFDLLPLPESLHDRMRGLHRNPSVSRLAAIADDIAAGRPDGGVAGFPGAMVGAGPLADNIRGLFPAAMDTTTEAVVWSLLALAYHPEWQQRVAEESRNCADQPSIEAMPITRSVVKEALRLFPPAPMLVRAAECELTLGGRQVARGQTVAISIYAMHRHRDLWGQPDVFDPSRWLGAGVDNPAYMPFGYGPRICVAAQFALLEVMTVTAQVVSRFALEPYGDAPQIGLQVTTRPLSAARVTARYRSVEATAG